MKADKTSPARATNSHSTKKISRTLCDWANKFPKSMVGTDTVHIRVQITMQEFFFYMAGAVKNGVSVETAVDYCRRRGLKVYEWSNDGYVMEEGE